MEPSSPAPALTLTQQQQWSTESRIFQIYDAFAARSPSERSLDLEIRRDEHVEYLTKCLRQLPGSFSVLDARFNIYIYIRPWLCYWALHSLALLGESVDADLESNAIDFLSRCQDPEGGYGGGPGQLSHLATTYAAVNSLITLGSEKSFSSINRGKLYNFLLRMKERNGAFRMHDAGEMDVRACYTAISVASVLNILDYQLVQNVGDYVLSCQTYEGGIAGEPGAEAHGGYTFCGLAAMILIGEVNRLDLTSLINWIAFRQGGECGFQGRANKLVDGCYSFWQGGALALIQRLHSMIKKFDLSDFGDAMVDHTQRDATAGPSEGEKVPEGTPSPDNKPCPCEREGHASYRERFADIGFDFVEVDTKMDPLFHSIALQQYVLLCSQVPEGGFRDKPGKSRDLYHTCYCLSGLSICQHSWSRNADCPPLPWAVMGPYSNLLEPLHPLYGIVLEQYREAYEFFSES